MKNTLLILGAGASKAANYCFPTGFELLQSINSHLFNDKNDVIPGRGEGEYVSDLTNKVISIIKKDTPDYEKQLKIYKKKLYKYVSDYEVKYLREALDKSISIDDFANQYNSEPVFQTISKYATAHILKGSEHAFYQSTNKKPQHWIDIFLQEFTKDVTNLQNISSRLQIVSFNYDRLFAYLFNKYLSTHHPAYISASAILEDSCIYYLYGSLGSLTDMPFESPNNDMGKMIHAYTKFQLLQRKIKTWSPDDTFDTIGFIGFGFDETNFENLNLKQFSDCKVYSSYYSDGELPNQARHLESVFKKGNIIYCPDTEELATEILNY